MKSAVPKVMHAVAGRPLLGHVLRAVRATGPEAVVVVVGNGRERVQAFVEAADPGSLIAVQEAQLGTGHAAQVALAALATAFWHGGGDARATRRCSAPRRSGRW